METSAQPLAGTARLVANVSMLAAEHPLPVRLAAIRDAGIRGVETWWPFTSPYPGPDEVAQFLAALEKSGLQLVAMNLYGGDPVLGERGVLTQPGRIDEVLAGVPVALAVAEATGCRLFNVPIGRARSDGADGSWDDQEALLQALAGIAGDMAGVGGTILLEPLSSAAGEHPAAVASLAAAAGLADALERRYGVQNAGVLFDVYHCASNQEDWPRMLREHAEWIRHVQIADAPGRGAPGSGAVDFELLWSVLEQIGYLGLISAEHLSEQPGRAFDWLAEDVGQALLASVTAHEQGGE